MMTIVYDYSFCDVKITRARKLTEEEKSHYADWAKDRILVSLGEVASLDHLKREDMPSKESDGEYNGTNNDAWIITEEECAAYIAENAKREKEALQEKINVLMSRIATMENQNDLPSAEEARRRMKAYNDLYNEGGEGFVPHIYSQNEYKSAKNELTELKERLANV